MTMDSLATPLALLLLPLPMLAALLLPPFRDRGVGAALRVPDAIAARFAFATDMGAAARTHTWLAWTVWAALVIALAGPRMLVPSPALPVSGRDIVLVLDLSGSMDRKDFSIDGQPARRLDAVKKVAIDFVRGRSGDRIGLVIFAERAFFAAAPTFDVESVARTIDEATIGIAGRSTAIGEGLGLALKRLGASPSPSRVVILLSDGANNAGTVGPSDVAVLARELGIRVHTIALGENDLESTTDDPDAVDAATLRRVAELSGGTAFRVRTTADLEQVGHAIDAMETSRGAAPPARVYRSLWIWPAMIALAASLAILALDWGLLPAGRLPFRRHLPDLGLGRRRASTESVPGGRP
jgi:Ca-activated chloride channel family protein